ncbi:MAG: hypothetical protein GX564_12765 [Oligosphaeraceae bacterium]|nr:hypothetical protein [Oligosphaeraceae bacterium]
MQEFEIFAEINQIDGYSYYRMVQEDYADYPSFTRGEYPVPFPPAAVFAESKRLGLFSAFRIGQGYPSRLPQINPEETPLHIDCFRFRYEDRGQFKGDARPGETYEEYRTRYYRELFAYQQQHPENVLLCIYGECDTGCPWPADRNFASREEAYQFFYDFVTNNPRATECANRVMHEMGLDWQRANVMIHGASNFAIPYYFAWGFPQVEIERGLGTSLNMQVSLGYLRGAWKQFGRKSHWGIDFSTHQPNYNQCNWYDENGIRIGGYSESFIERCWLYAWLGGAEYLLQEGSDYTHWTFSQDGSFRLSALGERAKAFADFTLRSGCPRGVPVCPAAVLLDYYNGYEHFSGCSWPRPSVWGNRLPANNTDLHIGNVFNAFYPGQSLTGQTDAVLNPDCPYRTRQEYRQMCQQGADLRHLELGHLVPSPSGDAVEVLWDNAALETMREYPVLIPAGSARLPEEVLEEYVAPGGTLAAAYNMLPKSVLAKLSAEQLPGKSTDWDYDRIRLADGTFSSDGQRYGFRRFSIPAGEVLACNSRDIPIVYRIPYQKGAVLLCTVPLGQELSGVELIGCWAEILRREVQLHYPVEFSSRGILQLAVNVLPDGELLLGLFNNTASPWSGEVKIKGREQVKASAVYPQAQPFDLQSATVEPFSAKIIRVSRVAG